MTCYVILATSGTIIYVGTREECEKYLMENKENIFTIVCEDPETYCLPNIEKDKNE